MVPTIQYLLYCMILVCLVFCYSIQLHVYICNCSIRVTAHAVLQYQESAFQLPGVISVVDRYYSTKIVLIDGVLNLL